MGWRRWTLAVVLLAAGSPAASAQPTSTPAPMRPPALAPAQAERFSRGVAALQAGNLDAAESEFRAVLAAGGGAAFVHHNLGIVLQRREQHAAAVREFHLASSIDPRYGPARLLAGASLIALGQPRAAIADLERAVALMPGEMAAPQQLADACERAGDVPCLVTASRAVAALAPADPEYAYRLGKAYLRLSQWSYERLRAVDPQSARLSQALGLQYLEQGQADQARAALETAATRDPRLPEVHLALARLHLDEGRFDDAAREIALELRVVPASRGARDLQARLDAGRAAGRR